MHEKVETRAVCKISPVKDGCYGQNSNNEAITKFNEQLEMICLELDGLYPWSKFECLDKTLTDIDISCDGVHPTINGIKTWWIKFGTVVLNNLGSPTLTSIYLLWTNYPLTLTFYPLQPNAYFILPPTGQITPSLLHHFTHCSPLLHQFTSSEQITPSLLHFTPLQPNAYFILPPTGQITPSLLHHFTHCSPLLHGNFSQG